MCMYLRTKFQVSSIILTGFRQGVCVWGGEGGARGWGNFTRPPASKRTPKKPTQIKTMHLIFHMLPLLFQ